MSAAVRVEGLSAVDEAFAQIPKALRRQVMLRALRKGASPIVREARLRAPRGTDPRRRGSKKDRKSGRSAQMGHAADSIKVRPAKPRSEYTTEVTIGPDSDHFYLSFSEFGTSRQKRQSFLRPAFDSLAESSIVPVSEELIKAIEQTAARLASKAAAGTLSRSTQRAILS